jgi:ferrochelatase
MMENKIGVLLVNLGTPASPQPKDVYRYLIEFLTDARVIDLPWLQRQLLVRGIIVPFRYRQSARQYQQIWTDKGSPLMIYGRNVQHALQQSLGATFKVELAMRYQEPSIEDGIANLLNADISHLIVLPLFPQYASATTGSVHERVQEVLKARQVIPKLTLINHYAAHPSLIDAFCGVTKNLPMEEYDHFLFSFHGLPERHIRKADPSGKCLSHTCCSQLCHSNQNCYAAQCHATARAIAQQLKLPKDKWEVSFQSRLGKEPWLQPYSSTRIRQLGQQGTKKLLVFCPAFVCDCLETLFEMRIENSEIFTHAGGERLDLVPGLNDDPLWIKALQKIVLEQGIS